MKLIISSILTKLKISNSNNGYHVNAEEYDLYPFELEFFVINAIDEDKN